MPKWTAAQAEQLRLSIQSYLRSAYGSVIPVDVDGNSREVMTNSLDAVHYFVCHIAKSKPGAWSAISHGLPQSKSSVINFARRTWGTWPPIEVKRRKYTSTETEQIREVLRRAVEAGNTTGVVTKLAEELGRTESQIGNKIRAMGMEGASYKTERAHWTGEATDALREAVIRATESNDSRSVWASEVWKDVSEAMHAEGYEVSPIQCKNRFISLRANSRVQFEELLDAIAVWVARFEHTEKRLPSVDEVRLDEVARECNTDKYAAHRQFYQVVRQVYAYSEDLQNKFGSVKNFLARAPIDDDLCEKIAQEHNRQ